MTRDEIKKIADIVGGDDTYRHFVNRINKEFDAADLDRQAEVKVIFQNQPQESAGFAVIGISPAKMRVWSEIFREEGWVEQDFEIASNVHELMYMYIKPEYRNKGYGRELLNQAFSHARDESAPSVYAYLSDRTDSAYNFYKKMDCEVIKDFNDSGLTTAFVRWQL